MSMEQIYPQRQTRQLRGDKPSVIAQLKKFQEQEERKGQYKQKTKRKG